MIRRLFMILSALSLLLCVALCALWLRSFVWEDSVCLGRLENRNRIFYLTSNSGHLEMEVSRYNRRRIQFVCDDAGPVPVATKPPEVSEGPWFGYSTRTLRSIASEKAERVPRFRTSLAGPPSRRAIEHQIDAPYWLMVLIMSLLTLAAVYIRRRSHLSRAAGLCPSCGYDLRATPDQCPECGAEPKKNRWSREVARGE